MAIKIVLQDGIKDCGICCLLSIIRYYGGDVSKEYLREITDTTKDGVSLYQLLNGASKLGFTATGVKGEITKINANNLPCIAHVIVNKNYKHFVVIYKIDSKNKQVTLMDPAKGKKIISFSEFNLLSSGHFLFLTPTKKLPIIKRKRILLKIIINALKTSHIKAIIFINLTIIYFILVIVTSFHFKYLLEYAINDKIIENVYRISALLLLIYLFKNLANILRVVLLNKILSSFDAEATFLSFKQILLLPYLFYKNRTTGEVIARFKDLTNIKIFLANLLSFISVDILSLIVFSILMIKFQPLLGIIIVLSSLSILCILKLNYSKKKKLLKKVSTNEDIINSYLVEAVSNVDTIKGSHLEKRLIDRFKIKYEDSLETFYKYSLNLENISFIKNFLSEFLTVLIYFSGSILVIKNDFSLGKLLVYQSFFLYFSASANRGFNLLENFSDFSNSLNRIEELYLIKNENFSKNYYYLNYELKGDIIFKNLTYKIGTNYLFKNLNLEIKKGQKILISGPSGSGKSTLVKMLMRYIDIPSGMLFISNIDINHYHLENIRKNITYVSSYEYLFTDTLRNNICLFKDVAEKELEEVINLTLVNEIKNNDLETLIEENGFNFSSGERQRIILARSLLRKSNIYIFDEAFGQIDISREKKILENIFKYLEGKTIIVISHRFNNKKLFDRVLRIESGVIIENKKLWA